jgi:PAS domain S-box-containing protein
MAWQYLYLLAILGATFGLIYLAIYARRHRNVPGAVTFFWLMLAAGGLSISNTLVYTSRTFEVALFGYRCSLTFIALLPVAWLIFAFHYTNRQWLARRRLALLALIPLVSIVLIWTYPLHGLFWRSVSFTRYNLLTLPEQSFGPWLVVHTIYSYGLVLVGMVVLIQTTLRSFRLYRQQAAALVLGTVSPVLGSLPPTMGLSKIGFTSVGLLVTGLVFGWAIFRYRLLDLAPVARDILVDRMDDGMLVLDAQSRVVDLNPAMQAITGWSLTQAIGQPVAAIFNPWRDVVQRFQHENQVQAEIMLDRNGTAYYYDLRILPLTNRHGQLNGRLILLHDMTRRKQTAEALQALNRRMQEELSLAHEIQYSLLPPPRPNWPRVDVICYTNPAREVGGDFYRYHAFSASLLDRPGNRYAFTIGDVSGKGASAALLMASSLPHLDTSLALPLTPGERLAYLDRVISPYFQPRRQYCAMCYVELTLPEPGQAGDEAVLVIANAGGIPPYIRRTNGETVWPRVTGFTLGYTFGAAQGYQELSLKLSRGDMIILTSDGVVEAFSPAEEMFGFERLKQAIAAGPMTSAEAMLNHLRAELEAFIGQAEPRDDLTLMVVQIRG